MKRSLFALLVGLPLPLGADVLHFNLCTLRPGKTIAYLGGSSPTLTTYAKAWEWWYANADAQALNAKLVETAACGGPAPSAWRSDRRLSPWGQTPRTHPADSSRPAPE
jgi:hypothetical protein